MTRARSANTPPLPPAAPDRPRLQVSITVVSDGQVADNQRLIDRLREVITRQVSEGVWDRAVISSIDHTVPASRMTALIKEEVAHGQKVITARDVPARTPPTAPRIEIDNPFSDWAREGKAGDE